MDEKPVTTPEALGAAFALCACCFMIVFFGLMAAAAMALCWRVIAWGFGL